jgi:hypothetical protein
MAPNNVVEWMGQHCPTKFSDDFLSVQNCEALHCEAESRFLLDLSEDKLV